MRELDRLCESYGDLLRHLDPAAASAAGSRSGDNQLGRFDEAGVREHLAAIKATASAIEELEVEDLADEIDRTALLDDMRVTVARFEEDRPHRRDPGFWLDHLTEALTSLLLRPAQAEPPGHRARAATERVAAIPAFLDTARATLARPPLLLVDGALGKLGGLGQLLAHAAGELGTEASEGAEALAAAVTAALQGLTRFGHWLRSEVEPEAGVGGALGEARFDRRIHLRYAVRAGASELWRYAIRLLDETSAALAVEARALGAGESWRELVARLEGDTVPAVSSLQGELERVRAALGDLAQAIAPGPAVAVAPPSLLGAFPEVTYFPPADPPLDGLARLMVPAERLSGFLVPTVAGAALAGRHVQESVARRQESEVRRRLRVPIAVHGWALYAEQWMAEIGMSTEGAEVARLARVLRAGGLLAADVGMHARAMPPSDALTLLTDRAGLRPDEAQACVRQILAHPTDASAAALGRRELLALRDAAGVRADDRTALERFHLAVLGFGALPPGLAGWGMGLAS